MSEKKNQANHIKHFHSSIPLLNVCKKHYFITGDFTKVEIMYSCNAILVTQPRERCYGNPASTRPVLGAERSIIPAWKSTVCSTTLIKRVNGIGRGFLIVRLIGFLSYRLSWSRPRVHFSFLESRAVYCLAVLKLQMFN